MSGNPEDAFTREAVQTVVTFLTSTIPKSDVPNIKAELKTEFLLAKKRSKTQKNNSKRKKKQVLTRKEKKALGFYDHEVHKSVKYADFLPMNEIWLQYIENLFDLKNNQVPAPSDKSWESFTQSIYRADFHGSKLTVIRSKCPGYVEKTGICILDTKNTFRILSDKDVVTTIPKKSCVFQVHLHNDMKLQIFGKHLCARPAERSTKKVKGHLHPDL